MQLFSMTWSDVDCLNRDIPVVVPIAATEQHSLHLPLFTDSLLLGEVVRRVEVVLAERVLVTPLMWLGNSHHHLDFPGTLSADPRTYLNVLISLAENLISQGFRRIILLNGHGGNSIPGQQALFEVRQKLRTRKDLLLLFSTYWEAGPGPSEAVAELQQRQMGHACEWETSMMLKLAPELVQDFAAAEEIAPGNAFRPAHRAWITKDRSVPGHIGIPAAASAEKGEALFAHFAANVVRLLERAANWNGETWEG